MTRIDNFLVAQVSRFAESIDLSYLSRLFLIASENHVTKTTLVSCSMGSFFFLPLTSEQVGRLARPRVSTRPILYEALYMYKEPLSHAAEKRVAAATPSSDSRPISRGPSALPASVHPFFFRSPRLAAIAGDDEDSQASVARDGDADKLTRDACVGSRAVRTSVPRARGRGVERSAQRAPSPCERGVRVRGRSSRLDSSIEGERERERDRASQPSCDHPSNASLPSFGAHENSKNCSRQFGEREKKEENNRE